MLSLAARHARLHVISDALISLAYFSIPFTLLYFVRKRRDLEFNWMFVCFAVFIVACGTTHLMEIWTVWHPDYWLSGTVKADHRAGLGAHGDPAGQAHSDGAALAEPGRLRSPTRARAADRRAAAGRGGRAQINEALEARVAERTAQLEKANELLRDRAQQTVMQQERLRALGQMASGIAHDINNAISPVALYTESLLETRAAA